MYTPMAKKGAIEQKWHLVDAKGKTYGASDPAFTYTATGFVNGEDAAVLTGALSRNPGETVAGSPYAAVDHCEIDVREHPRERQQGSTGRLAYPVRSVASEHIAVSTWARNVSSTLVVQQWERKRRSVLLTRRGRDEACACRRRHRARRQSSASSDGISLTRSRRRISRRTRRQKNQREQAEEDELCDEQDRRQVIKNG